MTADEKNAKYTKISHKYGHLTDYQLEIELNNIKKQDSLSHRLNELNISLKYNEIDEYSYEIEKNLLEYKDDDDKFSMNLLDINHKHGKIDDYEYEIEKNKLVNKNSLEELEIEEVKINYKFHKIEKTVYDKKMADYNGEPYINIPNFSWDPSDPKMSFFELDYNDYFISYLKTNGYSGYSDEHIVEKWLNDVCRSVASDFLQEDPTFVSSVDIHPATPTRKVKKRKTKRIEYS